MKIKIEPDTDVSSSRSAADANLALTQTSSAFPAVENSVISENRGNKDTVHLSKPGGTQSSSLETSHNIHKSPRHFSEEKDVLRIKTDDVGISSVTKGSSNPSLKTSRLNPTRSPYITRLRSGQKFQRRPFFASSSELCTGSVVVDRSPPIISHERFLEEVTSGNVDIAAETIEVADDDRGPEICRESRVNSWKVHRYESISSDKRLRKVSDTRK